MCLVIFTCLIPTPPNGVLPTPARLELPCNSQVSSARTCLSQPTIPVLPSSSPPPRPKDVCLSYSNSSFMTALERCLLYDGCLDSLSPPFPNYKIILLFV